ncbi:MAG TPA: hypothetical protein VF328_05465 [Mycobacterium sp.]
MGVKWSQVEILFSPTKDRSSEAVSVTIGAASFVRSKCWKARNTQKAEKARLFGQAVDCHSCGVVARLPVDIACNRGASHGRSRQRLMLGVAVVGAADEYLRAWLDDREGHDSQRRDRSGDTGIRLRCHESHSQPGVTKVT